MISDFVKGKKRFDFSSQVQKGIMLHRAIDSFTDTHAATKKAKEFFKLSVGLYAGAFVDIVYDHFLALDTNEFTNDALLNFSQFAYTALDAHINILPPKFAGMLPYMKRDNWLYNYKTTTGIKNSFGGLVRRAQYLDNNTAVFEDFINNYQALQHCYAAFFPEVKQFAFNQLYSQA